MWLKPYFNKSVILYSLRNTDFETGIRKVFSIQLFNIFTYSHGYIHVKELLLLAYVFVPDTRKLKCL